MNLGDRCPSARDWFEKGRQHQQRSEPSNALHCFRQSLKLNSGVAAPWIAIAQLLEANSQFEEARECLIRASAAEPKSYIARLHLANAHRQLGYIDDAKKEFDKVVSLNPMSPEGFFGLGQLLEDMGQPHCAVKAYRHARTVAPQHFNALARLLMLSQHEDVSVEVKLAQDILPRLQKREKALVAYGLGKALEREKQYAAAFSAYETANSSRRSETEPFHRDLFDARIQKMIALFSKELFVARRDWGQDSEQAVFIVGLPRSGTTLTEQIVASHPDCFGAGEQSTLTDLATGTPDRLDQAHTAWPDCVVDLTREHIEQLGQEYLARSMMRAPQHCLRIVDKQPLNFWHLGLVALALPNARIIHCRRDIRDCGLSIFSHNFNPQQTWATDLNDIAYYWQGYRRLMQHWINVCGLRIVELDYEDTVANPDASARKLLNFLDLSWDETVLRFYQNQRAVQTPSRWQVRQPIYKTSVAHWQNYGSKLAPLSKAAERGGF